MSILEHSPDSSIIRPASYRAISMNNRAARGERVKAIRNHFGDSQSAFARRLGGTPPLTQGAVWQWEKGGGLSDESRELFAALGVSMAYLLDGRGEMFNSDTKDKKVSQENAEIVTIRSSPGRGNHSQVPIMGTVEGGAYSTLFNDGEPIGMIDCPPSLEGVPGAYCVAIRGHSVEPWGFPDEIKAVHPFKTVVAGDFVVAQIEVDDGTHIIHIVKRFVKWTERELVLEQLNPPEKLRFPRKDVKALHKVVTWVSL